MGTLSPLRVQKYKKKDWKDIFLKILFYLDLVLIKDLMLHTALLVPCGNKDVHRVASGGF